MFKPLFILLILSAFTSSFYIIAPDMKNSDPFCYVNALSVQENNVLHWKVYEPRPKDFELFVTITDTQFNVIAEGSSKNIEDTLPFKYKKKDMVRICIESNVKEGLKIHLGYRLALLEGNQKDRANMKQADHLNQIVFDALNKLDNFMISENNINSVIDQIHEKCLSVANSLRQATRIEIGIIV